MLDVKKKQRRSLRHGRMWLLLCAVLMVVCVGAGILLTPLQPTVEEHDHDPSGVLAEYGAEQVQRLAITLRDGDSWAAVQSAEGMLTLEDDPDYAVSAAKASALLEAASRISYQAVLADDPADYADKLADFGLAEPRIVLDVAYTDGSRWVLRIGDQFTLEDGLAYYMLVEGDNRLFALDKGSAEELMVERALLHPVTQPTLHKARFDRITLADGQGKVVADWVLQGAIGGNALDRWLLTAPVQYPVDGTAMDALQDNLLNLRLGAYVGAATPENLAKYGFDQPRLVITVHQAAGSIGTTGEDGVYAVTDWPEDTFTLIIGGAKSDVVDYVRVGEEIYLTSHFTLEVFLDMDPVSTLSRYIVPVALGNLKSLTIRTAAGEAVYEIIRTERVAENNELVTDSQGHVLYDVACTLNGAEIGYAAFESAYNELLKATVSGNLPEGWAAAEAPHTTYIFQAVTGECYTLGLTKFEAMHDAVLLDGCGLFYLIKDGLAFDVK